MMMMSEIQEDGEGEEGWSCSTSGRARRITEAHNRLPFFSFPDNKKYILISEIYDRLIIRVCSCPYVDWIISISIILQTEETQQIA